MSTPIDRLVGPANQEAQNCLDKITLASSEARETQARLVRLMSEAKCRHGCSLSEIGEAAGVSKQSIHERLQRAAKK